jgi:hypothetical protein
MKDTIKNSIILALAIFGFVSLISSSNSAPMTINECCENKFNIVAPASGGYGVYMVNMQTGETWWINGKNTKVKHK